MQEGKRSIRFITKQRMDSNYPVTVDTFIEAKSFTANGLNGGSMAIGFKKVWFTLWHYREGKTHRRDHLQIQERLIQYV